MLLGMIALRILKMQYYVFPDFRIAVNVDAIGIISPAWHLAVYS